MILSCPAYFYCTDEVCYKLLYVDAFDRDYKSTFVHSSEH